MPTTKFSAVVDSILFYAPAGATFNGSWSPLDPAYVAKAYRHDDNDGKGKYRYGGRIRDRKYYLADSRGTPATSLWDDIPELNGTSKEMTGYPTQKPVALLERIVKAASNEGDWILDPFCGCATTCEAAEKHARNWVGIDVSPLAAKLVARRLHRADGLFDRSIHRTDQPQRTDVETPPNYKTQKHTLYGVYAGDCHYCGHHFPFHGIGIDHKVPRAKGGTDHLDNLVLACTGCNSAKGTMDYHEFLAKSPNR